MQTASPPAASKSRRFAPRGQRGVGLIEVLIAVLVLSIGLLGIALMQVRSLSGNNSSMARSSAVVASYSVLEILRAKRTDALGQEWDFDASDCDASGSAFLTEQLKNWCQNELTGLGENSQANVDCDAAGVCSVTITFHTLDCGQSGDGQQADSLCTQSVGEDVPAQQIVTKAML